MVCVVRMSLVKLEIMKRSLVQVMRNQLLLLKVFELHHTALETLESATELEIQPLESLGEQSKMLLKETEKHSNPIFGVL